MPEWMQKRLAGTTENPGEVELAPDEAPAVSLFLSLGTQWDRHAMSGQRTGLKYEAIPATAGMLQIEVTPAMFGDLQVMEAAALETFAERAKR